ncbi:MAG TPA: BolA/IbaG family iron-sulfur metabolism protein [Steroidobacteraceae bacterium]|nr:BolA/IbaG family iron-sulfur metabolism protein [Steroidobacteraceae bacterium]
MHRASREQRLREKLQAAFSPQELTIIDDSPRHAGHAGAAGGLGHFRIVIVAAAFQGLTALARHRKVYAAVGDMLETDIHALNVEARAPAERAAR